MVCVHTTSCCDALKYHKLSRVEQDRYEERRALKNPPVLAARVALSWPCADSQAQPWDRLLYRGKLENIQPETERQQSQIYFFFLFFFFWRREGILVCSLNHDLMHSSCILVFPPKGQADALLHQNHAEFLPAGEEPLCSSLEGAPSRLKYNHLFPLQQRWELWHQQVKGKEHAMWYKEKSNDVQPFFQEELWI